MSYKPSHLSEEVIERLDQELTQAIAAVHSGRATKAGVSLAFAVSLDDNAKPVVEFSHKTGTAVKGTFHPAVQPRLPLDDDEPVYQAPVTGSSLLRGGA